VNGDALAGNAVGGTVPARKVKVEFFDDVGTKHTITIDGAITKEKISRVLDYVELMGRIPNTPNNGSLRTAQQKFERIRDLLAQFQGRAFRSSDVQQAYEQIHGESIALSTVCTYLSRFVDRGVVLRSGSSAEWLYTVKPPGAFSWNNIVPK